MATSDNSPGQQPGNHPAKDQLHEQRSWTRATSKAAPVGGFSIRGPEEHVLCQLSSASGRRRRAGGYASVLSLGSAVTLCDQAGVRSSPSRAESSTNNSASGCPNSGDGEHSDIQQDGSHLDDPTATIRRSLWGWVSAAPTRTLTTACTLTVQHSARVCGRCARRFRLGPPSCLRWRARSAPPPCSRPHPHPKGTRGRGREHYCSTPRPAGGGTNPETH